MPDTVRLTVSLNKDNVQALPQPQMVYALMELVPPAAAEPGRRPLNICFALDQSGSMDGETIQQVKAAVKHAIGLLTADDYVSIITFATCPQRLIESQPARDPRALQYQIDRISPGGGTDLGRALSMGIDEMRGLAGPNRSNRILLLTDGQTENEGHCLHAADRARSLNIPIMALGIGRGWNDRLLRELGTRSGGQSAFMQSPRQIEQYFQGAARGAQTAVVQNTTLNMRLSAGMQPRNVWRVAPLIADIGYQAVTDRDVMVPLGRLEEGAGQAILLELMLPAKTEGRFRIARTEVSYDVPELDVSDAKLRANMIIGYTNNPALYKPIDARVMNMVEKVSAFSLQSRALSEARQGNLAGATQKLRAAAAMLVNQGEGEMAQIIRSEADRLEQQRPNGYPS